MIFFPNTSNFIFYAKFVVGWQRIMDLFLTTVNLLWRKELSSKENFSTAILLSRFSQLTSKANIHISMQGEVVQLTIFTVINRGILTILILFKMHFQTIVYFHATTQPELQVV